MVPPSSTRRPGMNFSVAGLGVASVWMNMAFSGVSSSRLERWTSSIKWRLITHRSRRKSAVPGPHGPSGQRVHLGVAEFAGDDHHGDRKGPHGAGDGGDERARTLRAGA